MASRTISTKMAITGQSEFQVSITNINNINNSLKTLRSETAMLDAQYQGHANSLAALTARGPDRGPEADHFGAGGPAQRGHPGAEPPV